MGRPRKFKTAKALAEAWEHYKAWCGDQIYTEELIRENAQLKQENETLASQVNDETEDWRQVSEGLKREKVLAAKLDQAIRDLHFVMAGGDSCTVCKNKCLMSTADTCEPHWKGLND